MGCLLRGRALGQGREGHFTVTAAESDSSPRGRSPGSSQGRDPKHWGCRMGFAPNVGRAGWAPRPGGCEGARGRMSRTGKSRNTLRARDPVPQPQPDPVGQEASTELPQGGGGPRMEESPAQSPPTPTFPHLHPSRWPLP